MKKLILFALFSCCSISAWGATSTTQQADDQAQMEKEIHQSHKDFHRGVKTIMPMSNAQVEAFRAIVRKHALSAVQRGAKLNKRRVSFKVDNEFHSMAITPGYVTTLSFADVAGNPWPVEYILPGNEKVFAAGQPSDDKYTIMLTAVAMAGESNIVVKLKDVPSAIHLTVHVYNSIVDYSVTGRVRGVSPDAVISAVPSTPVPAIRVNAAIMGAFLSGNPPQDAKKLHVDREGIEAWMFNDKMYIKTIYNMVSPDTGENGVASDSSGMHVYRLKRMFRKPMFLTGGQYFFTGISNGK